MLCANQTKTQYGRTPRMHMAIRCNTVHHYYHRLLDPTHLRVGPPVNDIGSMSERLPGSRIQCRAPVWIQDPVKSVCLDPGSGSERSIVSGNRLNPPARATGCWVVVWVSPFSHGSYILPCYCHATAMLLPCHCHATAMLQPGQGVGWWFGSPRSLMGASHIYLYIGAAGRSPLCAPTDLTLT